MNAQDQRTFLANIEWFNDFFTDLHNIFREIEKALKKPFGLADAGFYYKKSDSTPAIPPYCMMGMGGDDMTVQVFAILDPTILEGQSGRFALEPSIVVVIHAAGRKGLSVEAYGLSIMRGDKNIHPGETAEHGTVTGTLHVSGKRIPFYAFQLPLSRFGKATDLDNTINTMLLPRISSSVEHLKQTAASLP